ncbi:MAG: NADH-quinone oxidoreductase subunit J [Candidatus Micrarchaeota archaeon]|nr:NADH-quinone oxidoreductase subunit J [Candidatus Micrarchaeota archaeon]
MYPTSVEFYAYAAITVIMVVSAALMFLQKRLLYSAIALAFVFAGSALMFLLLGQAMLALIQLLVFVGGLSTYLIVAIATEEKVTKLVSPYLFVIAAVVISLGLSLFIGDIGGTVASGGGTDVMGMAALAFKAYWPLFYAMMFLLFAATIGTVVVVKKFVKLVV